MCGRFFRITPQNEIARQFQVELRLPVSERYNIAPTQDVLAIRNAPGLDEREAALFKWGLIPSWAQDPSIGSRMINARAETIAEKPAFRAAFKSRRCLIAADGFYEWKKEGPGKQPYAIRLKGGGLCAFAGLWERWKRPDQEIESCTIITTQANDLTRELHDRMPVIIAPDEYDRWLDPDLKELVALEPLLRPFPPEMMELFPVSRSVNSPANDAPDLLIV